MVYYSQMNWSGGKAMDSTYKINLRKTISGFFPAYLKKELLKQVVNEGLVINNRKKGNQLSLTFADIVDVTECDTLDEKIDSILAADNVL